jgi:hypothetical protein
MGALSVRKELKFIIVRRETKRRQSRLCVREKKLIKLCFMRPGRIINSSRIRLSLLSLLRENYGQGRNARLRSTEYMCAAFTFASR